MYDYLIVGAGLYGATFARLAAERGCKCLVIDKRQRVGGNCADEFVNGIHVHKYGAHIFHTDYEQVWNFVNEFMDFVPYVHNVKAIYKDKIYSLPFNMNTFAELFGTIDPRHAKQQIEEEIAKAHIGIPTNLEEQAISLVGTTVYEKLIKHYTEKQWGTSCKNLSPDIIKRLPLRFTYNNNYFNDKYQGLPKDGYTAFVKQLLGHYLIDVELTKNFFDINDPENIAKKIVFTGPIDAFFEYRLGELDWRTLRFETRKLDVENYQGAPVINYCDYKPYTRIIEHKHFLKEKSPVTYITVEYPDEYHPGDEQYYPIDNTRNRAIYAKYCALAEKYPNVIFGGRLGTYKYFDMDDVIMQAMNDVEKEFNE